MGNSHCLVILRVFLNPLSTSTHSISKKNERKKKKGSSTAPSLVQIGQRTLYVTSTLYVHPCVFEFVIFLSQITTFSLFNPASNFATWMCMSIMMIFIMFVPWMHRESSWDYNNVLNICIFNGVWLGRYISHESQNSTYWSPLATPKTPEREH